MGRHGMRWEELRWDELRWSASVKCGVWGVKSAMWSVRKVFALYRGRAQVMFLDSNTATASMRWSVECEECSVKCGAWRVQCEVWSVKKAMRSEKCEVWTVKCDVWSVECEVWIGKSAVWSEKCEVCSVECEECSEKCEGRSGASNVTCETRHHFRRVHARTGLAGARRMQVSIDEKSLNISLRQLPPRLVRVLLVYILVTSFDRYNIWQQIFIYARCHSASASSVSFCSTSSHCTWILDFKVSTTAENARLLGTLVRLKTSRVSRVLQTAVPSNAWVKDWRPCSRNAWRDRESKTGKMKERNHEKPTIAASKIFLGSQICFGSGTHCVLLGGTWFCHLLNWLRL